MAIIPTEPDPGPNPVPDLPPIGEPTPPIKEPEPDRLPDEEPNPNPDESDEPAKQTGFARGFGSSRFACRNRSPRRVMPFRLEAEVILSSEN